MNPKRATKWSKVAGKIEVVGKTEGWDPFSNTLSRTTGGPSGKLSGSDLSGNLKPNHGKF